jgi:hypothetical protein
MRTFYCSCYEAVAIRDWPNASVIAIGWNRWTGDAQYPPLRSGGIAVSTLGALAPTGFTEIDL